MGQLQGRENAPPRPSSSNNHHPQPIKEATSMRKLLVIVVILVIVVVGGLLIYSHIRSQHPQPGTVKDEALQAGRDAASLPGADEDYYADMDYGLTKNPEAIRASLDPYLPGISAAEAVKRVAIGRNNWVAWTAGNDPPLHVLSLQSPANPAL